MDIKQNIKGCVEILYDFGIINTRKHKELQKRVDKEELKAYDEVASLIEEIATSITDFTEGGA